jgi:hypothetical protein
MFHCWDIEAGSESGREIDAFDARGAAELYAERLYSEEHFETIEIGCRGLDGVDRLFVVDADHDVSFSALEMKNRTAATGS